MSGSDMTDRISLDNFMAMDQSDLAKHAIYLTFMLESEQKAGERYRERIADLERENAALKHELNWPRSWLTSQPLHRQECIVTEKKEPSRYSTPKKLKGQQMKEPDQSDASAHLAWRLRRLHNSLADDHYNDGAVRCLRQAAARMRNQDMRIEELERVLNRLRSEAEQATMFYPTDLLLMQEDINAVLSPNTLTERQENEH